MYLWRVCADVSDLGSSLPSPAQVHFGKKSELGILKIIWRNLAVSRREDAGSEWEEEGISMFEEEGRESENDSMQYCC